MRRKPRITRLANPQLPGHPRFYPSARSRHRLPGAGSGPGLYLPRVPDRHPSREQAGPSLFGASAAGGVSAPADSISGRAGGVVGAHYPHPQVVVTVVRDVPVPVGAAEVSMVVVPRPAAHHPQRAQPVPTAAGRWSRDLRQPPNSRPISVTISATWRYCPGPSSSNSWHRRR